MPRKGQVVSVISQGAASRAFENPHLLSLGAPLALVTLATLPAVLTSSSAVLSAVLLMLTNVVFVVALFVFSGNSGVLSFGHMAFMAVGAYVGGLLSMNKEFKSLMFEDLPGWLIDVELSLFAALAACFVLALTMGGVLAIPLMRLSGLAASISTLALLQVVHIVTTNWDAVFGPSGAMVGVPIDLSVATALVITLAVIAIAHVHRSSDTGLRLQATREDEPAAAAAGVNIVIDRGIAFALSAGIAAISGVMYGHTYGAFGSSAFYLGPTFLAIAMLIIGGRTSLWGAVVGAVVLSALTETLLQFERTLSVRSLTDIVLATAMLGMLLWRPKGLTGGREARLRVRTPIASPPLPAEDLALTSQTAKKRTKGA